MSVHLVGGGWADGGGAETAEAFVAESAARAQGAGRAIPRIAVLLVGDPADPAGPEIPDYRAQYTGSQGATEVRKPVYWAR